MPDKQQKKKKKHEHSDWELEQQFDLAATLDELINEPPFKEVSGEGGDSRTVAARVPHWLHRRAKKLKEVDGSPYDVDSDVYRDAIYLGLKILNMRHHINPDWNVESKLAGTIDSAMMARRLKNQVKLLTDALSELWKDGDERAAAEHLTKYIGEAVEIESPWHKSRLFRLLAEDVTVRTVLSACDKSTSDTIHSFANGDQDRRSKRR